MTLKIIFLIIFICSVFSSARASENDKKRLPVLECQVRSTAGAFNSYLPPMEGDKFFLDLMTLEERYKKDPKLIFFDQAKNEHYIPSGPLVLTVLDNQFNDRFYIRLKYENEKYKLTLDIHPLGEDGYQMFIVEEHDLVHSVAYLDCKQIF